MDRLTTRRTGRAAAACWGVLVLSCVANIGCNCISSGKYAVPARRIQAPCLVEPKEGRVPIDFSLLTQPKPVTHIIGPGDLLGVYVFGVLPPDTSNTPLVQRYETVGDDYYPPTGPFQGPSLGLPIQVGEKGTLSLPLVGELPVEGLTVSQATEKIRLAYRDKDILNNEKSERVLISLIKPRVTRVLVVRSDTELDAPQFLDTRRVEYSKRGYAQTLDLPPSENDVMHALTATDGLPGTDAKNEVWVIRAGAVGAESMLARLKATDNPESLIQEPTFGPHCIRIPLSVLPGEPVCFTPDDVILHPGDIVYVPPRNEYFFTGGLLNGAKIPLPRDEDVDIIEAIAMAQGSVGGPLATSGQNSLRFSNKPGYVIPPSRAIVIRKLPNGQQLPIRVDLGRALRDPRERLVIQPDDLVTVQYTASELAANIAINIVNVNFIFSPDR